MNELKAMFSPHHAFNLSIGGYPIGVSMSLVIQWGIMLLVILGCIFLTRNLKKVPGKRQNIAEMLVQGITKLVKNTMGEEYASFSPYIGTLMVFLVFMNLTGLVGIEPPTRDYSVALGMALTSFIVIQAFAIKKIGLGHYFKAYASPFAALTPINLMERVMLPVSLSLRLFGNIMAAAVIMKLIYIACGLVSPFTQVLIPVPFHLYFDLFDGTVQMVIFSMLTMVNIKIIAEH